MSKHDKKEERILLKTSVLITSIILFLALLSPILLTKSEALGIVPSNISDVYSGVNIMTPFVAIASVVVTFLAFYAQYKANVKLKEDAERQELDLKRQQLERQFYEMLKIHKDNVNEIKWEFWGMVSSVTKNRPQSYNDFHIPSQYGYRSQQGRNVFRCYLAEINFIYNLLYDGYDKYVKYCEESKIECKDLDEDKTVKLACDIFFWGKDVISKEMKRNDPSSHEYIVLERQKKCVDDLSELVPKHGALQDATTSKDYELLYGANVMKGHFNELNHYYRHLYQMVKYVASFDEKIISYKEKRKYLRMLRAQLTNNEQLMLFYNWKSGYGGDWESLNGNHFFTDYRMIHNIDVRESCYFVYSKKGVPEKLLVDMMKECNPSIRSEEDENGNERTDDYLFEFEN
jgi:hypothetical protein